MRELVLLLWAGSSQKQAARSMGISVATVHGYVSRIGGMLPGTGNSSHKIILWRSEVILAALPDTTILALKPVLNGQMLSVDAQQPTRGVV